MFMGKSKSKSGKIHIIADSYGYSYCGINMYIAGHTETEETPTCKTCIKLAHREHPGMLRYMVYFGIDYECGDMLPELYTSVEAAQEACYSAVHTYYDTFHIYELDLISNKINGSFMYAEIHKYGQNLTRDCKWETGE